MKAVAQELMKYAELEGSEWGDAMVLLCQLVPYGPSFFGDEFNALLKKELQEQLQYVTTNATMVETTETYTRTVTTLEWKDN